MNHSSSQSTSLIWKNIILSKKFIDSIIREAGSWIFVEKAFQGMSMSTFARDWVTSISSSPPLPFKESNHLEWQPPHLGILKLNFDGSSFGNPDLSGYRRVIRDHIGKVICIVVGPIAHGDSTKAELMGLIMGLRELKSSKFIRMDWLRGTPKWWWVGVWVYLRERGNMLILFMRSGS